jgi:hypothetical protein
MSYTNAVSIPLPGLLCENMARLVAYYQKKYIMASSEQLKALIKSHISRDDGHFYSVAMQMAAHEAKLGHGKLAEELRDLIDAAKTRLGQDSSGKLVPIASSLSNLAKPRGELANLLTVAYPANRLGDMVLDDLASSCSALLKSNDYWLVLKNMGSHPVASCYW